MGCCFKNASSDNNVGKWHQRLDSIASVDRRTTGWPCGGLPELLHRSFEAVQGHLGRIEASSSRQETSIHVLRRFYGSIKSADESVDWMPSYLEQLGNEIQEITPASKPSKLTRAIILINACKVDEYEVSKDSLLHEDMLTPELAVKRFRNVEQDTRKPKGGTNVVKWNRGKSYATGAQRPVGNRSPATSIRRRSYSEQTNEPERG